MKTRTELMRNINDMMTFAGHSLTEDQDAVLCAALQTLIPDYFQPCPEINRQLLDVSKELLEVETLIGNRGYHPLTVEMINRKLEAWQKLRDAVAAAEKEICK